MQLCCNRKSFKRDAKLIKPHQYFGRGLIWVIISLLSLIGGTLVMPSSTVAQSGTVILAMIPANSQIAVGQTITVTVQVQAGSQQVDGAAAYLNFDPTRLRVVSLTPGTTLPIPLANSFDNAEGKIDFAAGSLSSFPSGTFNLVQIALRGVAETSNTTINYNNTMPRQSNVTRGGQSVLGSELPASVRVSQPTAITLSSITARGVADNTTCRVTLAWTMATEIKTVGFNLYRSEQVGGPYTRLNAALIRGTRDWLLGGRHEYEDTSVEPGKTYYYEVEEIELNGTSTRHPPIMATAPIGSEGEMGGALETGLGVGALLLAGASVWVVRRNRRA